MIGLLLGSPDLFTKYMPKSVLQSKWFYRVFMDVVPGEKPIRAIEAYEALDRLGYEQVPGCSTWNNNQNTFQTLVYGRDKLSENLLLGYLTIPWCGNKRDDEYILKKRHVSSVSGA